MLLKLEFQSAVKYHGQQHTSHRAMPWSWHTNSCAIMVMVMTKKKKTQIGDTFGKQASTQDLKHAWPWHGPKATVTWMAHKDAGMDQGTICQSFSSMDA